MNLLSGKIKSLYFKYLSAAFGSALISCIYGVVDMAMVGQYQGPDGTAALAVVAPVWNIIYSLGLLMGIGGSIIFSTKRGSENNDGKENQYFTAALIGSIILSVISWAGVLYFEEPILRFFGANDSLLPLAEEYMYPIRYAFPLFLYNQMLAAFLRNDNDPGLATVGVLSGGERNRVQLAQTLKSEANVLLLDEPTNDLDVNTIRALEEGLENFAGCALVISHDRWFLDRVATHILAFENDSEVRFFDGNYTQYEEDRRKRLGIDADTPHRTKYRSLTRV